MKKSITQKFFRLALLCAVWAGVSAESFAGTDYYVKVDVFSSPTAAAKVYHATSNNGTKSSKRYENSDRAMSTPNAQRLYFSFENNNSAVYKFEGWSLNNPATSGFSSQNQTWNTTFNWTNDNTVVNKVYANFSFYIKVAPASDITGGTARIENATTAGKATFFAGDKAILTATPALGYEFAGWQRKAYGASAYGSTVVSTDATYELTVAEDHAGDTYKPIFNAIPVEGITFGDDEIVIDGTAEEISGDIEGLKASTVILSRPFVSSTASTVILPFDFDLATFSTGKFYTFGGVSYEESESKWVADMNEVTTSISANTPYLFMPDGNLDELKFTSETGITLENVAQGSTGKDDWTFSGTFDKLTYGDNLTAEYVYGFAGAAQSGAGLDDVKVGDFVRAGAGATILPTRCYLTRADELVAAPLHRAAAAPTSIEVRLHSSDGQVTKLDEQLKVVDDTDQWYTIDGRKLSGQPTTKGIFIKNGKKYINK